MKTLLIVLVILTCLHGLSCAQDFRYNKTKKSILEGSTWLTNIAESKIFERGLIIGKLQFLEDYNSFDTICEKIKVIDKEYGLMTAVFDTTFNIIEIGNGRVDFYKERSKEKHTDSFYYFIANENDKEYFVLIVDMDGHGKEILLPFELIQVSSRKGSREFLLQDFYKIVANYHIQELYCK